MYSFLNYGTNEKEIKYSLLSHGTNEKERMYSFLNYETNEEKRRHSFLNYRCLAIASPGGQIFYSINVNSLLCVRDNAEQVADEPNCFFKPVF